MTYIVTLESRHYNFKFTEHIGPEDTGIAHYVQVSLPQDPRCDYQRAVISDTVDHFSDEVWFTPSGPAFAEARRLAEAFAKKYYYGDKA